MSYFHYVLEKRCRFKAQRKEADPQFALFVNFTSAVSAGDSHYEKLSAMHHTNKRLVHSQKEILNLISYYDGHGIIGQSYKEYISTNSALQIQVWREPMYVSVLSTML